MYLHYDTISVNATHEKIIFQFIINSNTNLKNAAVKTTAEKAKRQNKPKRILQKTDL